MDDAEVTALKEELGRARAEEAKALRLANDLRAIGADSELKSAIRDVDLLHSNVARLQSELRRACPAPRASDLEQDSGSSA